MESTQPHPRDYPVPRRLLGKTGRSLSVIGFGGILVMNAEPRHAADVVAEAVDRGVNYFDVAPSYGNAEEILGPALSPHRDKVFLACKTGRRDRKGAWEQLEESLKRLHTSYFDLYQLHGLIDLEKDVGAAFGPDGAMEALVKAREKGLARHLGFSAHTPEAAVRAMELFDFDTILYPINVVCHHHRQFEVRPLEEARRRKMGILALKAMARTSWDSGRTLVKRSAYAKCWYEPFTRADDAREALRFTLSQPGVTAALPPGEEALFWLALDLLPEVFTVSDVDQQFVKMTMSELTPIF
ncbi:MAG: aldo/keto reductase [bacterium]